MGLRFDPKGGGQFKQQIKTIMEAEAQPLRGLEQKKALEEQKLKLFQDFKKKFGGIDKALSEVSTFKKLRELKVDLGEGTHQVSVTIDKDRANPGSYELEVKELASRTSVMSNGFEKPDEPILGMGFIVMHLENGESAEIFVDTDKSSLRGIESLINNQPGAPVRASVVKDSSDPDAPWRLIINGKKEGLENSIEFPEFYFMDGANDFYIEEDRESQNAVVSIDGFPVELDSNDVTDFLPGVNLHLKQAKPGERFTLNISEDTQKISGKVKGLVDQLNGVLQFIHEQNAVNESTDTRTMFTGDTGLQNIEYRIRNLMHEGFPIQAPDGEVMRVVRLSELGFEFDKTGQILFKEDKFTKVMEKDFEAVSQSISGEWGLAFQLREMMAGYTRPGSGILNMREQSMRNRIKDIDYRIDQKARVLERRQQSLVDQFSKLETALGNMQRQQQYLSASLGGGGGNPIAQLLG